MRRLPNAALIISVGYFAICGAQYHQIRVLERRVETTQQLLDKSQNLNEELLYDVEDLNQSLELANQAIEDYMAKLDLLQNRDEILAPATQLYNIPLSEEMQQYIYNKCAEYGIVDNYELVLAMIWNESNFNANAISSTDDYGLMQINKCNHKWLSKKLGINNFLDPKQNVDAGIYMLSGVLHKYGNVDLALMAYNRGEASAESLWKKGVRTNNYTRNTQVKLDGIKSDSYSEK